MAVFGTGHEVVTSSTRPPSPSAGQVIYETDTNQHRFYDGAAWRPIFQSGLVKAFAGKSAPPGWLLCAGSAGTAVTQSAYPDLFSVLTNNGTAYPFGGSGTTTYTPDLRGRAVHGVETMGGGAAINLVSSAVSGVNGTALGAFGGSQEGPAHNHLMSSSYTFLGSTYTIGSGSSSNENTNHAHQWTLGGNGGALGTGDLPHRGFYGWDGNFSTWGSTGFGYGAGGRRHYHTFAVNGTTSGGTHSVSGTPGHLSNLTGGSQNLAPTVVMNYLIKT